MPLSEVISNKRIRQQLVCCILTSYLIDAKHFIILYFLYWNTLMDLSYMKEYKFYINIHLYWYKMSFYTLFRTQSLHMHLFFFFLFRLFTCAPDSLLGHMAQILALEFDCWVEKPEGQLVKYSGLFRYAYIFLTQASFIIDSYIHAFANLVVFMCRVE